MRSWRLRPGDQRAVCQARDEFAAQLRSKHIDADECHDAMLIFGELVANAVKSARSRVVVELKADGWLTLHIVDDGDCFAGDNIAPRPLCAEDGRGLYIVRQLARELRVTPREHRCEVTAVLRIHG